MDPHLPVIHMVRMKIHRKKSFLLLRIQLLKHITCRIRNSSAKSFKALIFHLRINVYHLILHTVIINKFHCFFILFKLFYSNTFYISHEVVVVSRLKMPMISRSLRT